MSTESYVINGVQFRQNNRERITKYPRGQGKATYCVYLNGRAPMVVNNQL
jgi:hypothetical protein